MLVKNFWADKRVLITGHTGFKGAWLSLILSHFGARVTGYALNPPTIPNLFELVGLDGLIDSRIADIRDGETLKDVFEDVKPEIIIHMAAQSLVRKSYRDPVETFSTNVMGTVNLFESIRNCRSVKAVVNVTSDKCYENREWVWGYRESDPMGGYDPYSSSKGCAELITSSYRNSFFNSEAYEKHGVGLASARAGNVIGGGDWAEDRLIPDCIKALLVGQKLVIRSPESVRPWQHVLEPLGGYLLLAQKLYEKGPRFAEAWNFGPEDNEAKTVRWIVERMCSLWGAGAAYEISDGDHPHEANYLKLDCSKAKMRLGWRPKWDINLTLEKVVEWAKVYEQQKDVKEICLKQIEEYFSEG